MASTHCWVSIAPHGRDVNDPDVVTTGDAAFDEVASPPAREEPQLAAPVEFGVGGGDHTMMLVLLWAGIALFATIFYFA